MIKVRIAPSPTGPFHIGNAQSALYNWLFTRKNGGKFLVRIEDTDKVRSSKESEENIIESLSWLSLKPDDNIVRQSDNLSRHVALLEKLLREDKAFYCHHSQEDLETERRSQERNTEAPRHICEHKNIEIGKTGGGIIRLSVDSESDRMISFDDQIRGKVEFRESLLGDFSIARAVDDPLYNFAVVADDNEMEITHVIRGEDHISNTPKQILIYEALGFTVPLFAHLPLILGPDRSKLSKRHGGTSTLDYQKDYLPEALVNFLGSLSHTFSKEVVFKEEMIEEFDLGKVHKSGAVFDIKKLNWINSQYVKKLSVQKFKNIIGIPEIPDAAVPLITERLEKISDVQNFDYFWKEPEYDKELLKWKKATPEESLKALNEVKNIIEKIDFKNEILRVELDKLGEKLGDRGLAYWPLRVALTGKDKSPDPVNITFVLGKEKTLKRVMRGIEKV